MIEIASVPTRSTPADVARHTAAVGVAGSAVADRFCFWRGRSGRRYVFSVYRTASAAEIAAAPRYADAVVIAARRAGDNRRALRVCDTGALPELLMDGPADTALGAGADELHFHLLAGSVAERRAVAEDLGGAVTTRA